MANIPKKRGRKPNVMPEITDNKDDKVTQNDPNLPNKSLFRVDEAAEYFSVSDRTIRLWIEHGHLKSEKVVGSIRVSRESILRCRFR